jgi:signal transduction histidine kinase
MDAIGQLTGGIAHDFNNLLTGIIGSLDIVRRRMDADRLDEIPRFIDAASASAQKAGALTHRLLAFARRQSLDVRPNDINRLVSNMEDLLHRTLGEHIELKCSLRSTHLSRRARSESVSVPPSMGTRAVEMVCGSLFAGP